MSNVVNDYGWNTSTGPESCGYIAPKVMSILRELGAHRICDLGSGNGALAAAIKAAGYYSVGVEYDKQGVDLSIKTYPDIHFYNLDVQDNPAFILDAEGGVNLMWLFQPKSLNIYFHPIFFRNSPARFCVMEAIL